MELQILIRKYRLEDQLQASQLFHDTVCAINSRDYSEQQIQAWANPEGIERLGKSLSKNFTYVAELNGAIVGFGDLTKDGLVDHLYVHHKHQGEGVATKILEALEERARELHLTKIEVESSITAQPFFESKGYRVVEKRSKEARGALFTTYMMVKSL